MILNKVKLNDFVSHKDSELNLGYGINVVVGPNGAGKTSILDAISFALFNDYSGRGKRENLINSKASKCRAAVEFTEGGIGYAVEWSMDRNKSARGSLYRSQNGSRSLLAQGGRSAVVPEVEKILSMDKSMFAQSIYVRQGEIEELVTAKPADRKTLISKLLGVEDLQRAWESIRSIIDEFERTSDQLKGELLQRSTIEEERQKYVKASKDSETRLQSKKAELDEIELKIRDLKALLEKLKEDKKSFDRLDKQKGILEKQIEGDTESLNNRRSEFEEAVKSEKKVKSLKADVSKLEPLENLVAAISEKKEQELQKQRLAEKVENRARLETTLADNEADHRLYLEKESFLKEKTDERKRLESVAGALEEASRHIQQAEKDERKKSSDLGKELTKWGKALEAEVSVDNFEIVLQQKKEQSQLAAEEQGRIVDELNAKIGALKNKLIELEGNISRFKEIGARAATCPTCETELPADRVVQLVSKFTLEKTGIDGELQKVNSKLEQATETKSLIDERFRKVDQLDTEKLKGLKEEVSEKDSKLKELRDKISQLEGQAEALAALDEDLKRLESEKGKVEEAFQEFESAKRELKKQPSTEDVQAEMEPIASALKAASERVKASVSALGYEPEEPEKDLASVRKNKQEYDQNIAMANRRPELEASVRTTEQTLHEEEGKLVKINEDVKKLAYDEEEHSSKQKEFDDEKQNKSELDKDITRLATEKNAAEDGIGNCDRKLKDLKNKEREKKAVDGFIGLLNRIRTAYGKDGVQKMIRATARPLLERSSRDLFERFNLAYSDIKIDDDYNISVIGPAGEQDIDQISGGERVALAIALRLAIAQVLSGRVETIIMDEPTTHLDEERRKELVNILSSFLREGGRIIPQMLIITHHREIEDVADVIYTIKKENAYSIVGAESSPDV
jgi:exonuclease SbcC